MQLLDDLVKRLDLFQVFLSTNDNQLFLSASDRHIKSLQVLKQDAFVRSLFGTGDNNNVAVNTLRLVDCKNLFNAVLAEMVFEK
jgi:hypothetical protein